MTPNLATWLALANRSSKCDTCRHLKSSRASKLALLLLLNPMAATECAQANLLEDGKPCGGGASIISGIKELPRWTQAKLSTWRVVEFNKCCSFKPQSLGVVDYTIKTNWKHRFCVVRNCQSRHSLIQLDSDISIQNTPEWSITRFKEQRKWLCIQNYQYQEQKPLSISPCFVV